MKLITLDDIQLIISKLKISINQKLKVMSDSIANLEAFVNGANKLITSPTDPGTKARTDDVWLDTTNNVFKVKKSDGTWKIIGAAYN